MLKKQQVWFGIQLTCEGFYETSACETCCCEIDISDKAFINGIIKFEALIPLDKTLTDESIVKISDALMVARARHFSPPRFQKV